MVQRTGKRTVAATEALDVGVPIRLAWLNVVRRHAVFRTPVDKGLRRKFGAVIDADG